MKYTMNSVITVLYFNEKVYEDNDGVIFEGSKKAIQIKRGISFNALKKKIGDKVKLQNNEIISAISCRFLVSGKYIALQICDDEDVKTMLESFKQQDQMSVLELYIEKNVAGGWQISPNGVLLQTYSPNPNGVLFEQFLPWCCFLRGLHAKCMQNASSNGDFVGIGHVEAQPASAAGDFTWKLVPPAVLATSWLYMMNSVMTVLYFNGRVYEDNDSVIFEGSKKVIQIKREISLNALKKKIGDKVKLQNNEIISAISCRFLVSGKYIALQICDDEDVETMLESFKQQEQMSVLELYIEKDVAGGSMFHSANSLTSCGNYLSNDETQPTINMSNLHIDEDDDGDDDDYLVSNSYVEESLDEDDSVDGISDTDDEVTNIPQPVRIVHPTKGAQRIENPFWNNALHYNNINWSYRDEEDICGLEMPSTFNVGQELYVGMEFDSKDAVKNAVKQYVMKVHQSFKVIESKSNKYVVCCLNKNAECPCPFYMRAILFKKTDTWKVTQWGGPHTCLNMTMTQDHEKLDSNLIATCVVEAVKYCKPIIQVDGTHLYGKYRGTLLMATSQDGNGGVLPLAFAVVEDKNDICLISDRHASIKSAVANEALGWQPPHGYHVYCVRHIASNFNRKFNNAKQKEMLKKLEKFRELSPAIATWIDRISKEK
ncbi:hypothetical protein HKD37_18G050814 [Glycine soja]